MDGLRDSSCTSQVGLLDDGWTVDVGAAGVGCWCILPLPYIIDQPRRHTDGNRQEDRMKEGRSRTLMVARSG